MRKGVQEAIRLLAILRSPRESCRLSLGDELDKVRKVFRHVTGLVEEEVADFGVDGRTVFGRVEVVELAKHLPHSCGRSFGLDHGVHGRADRLLDVGHSLSIPVFPGLVCLGLRRRRRERTRRAELDTLDDVEGAEAEQEGLEGATPGKKVADACQARYLRNDWRMLVV